MPAGLSARRQVVEGAIVGPADHLAAFELAQHFVLAAQHVQRALGQVEHFIALAHFDVGQVRADGGGHIAGQRPGRGRPDQQRFALGLLAQREAQGDAAVGELA